MCDFFDDIPPYGRLITLPTRRPDYQVVELIEYEDKVLRNPVGRAWDGDIPLLEVPERVYELVPLRRGSDLFNDGQSSPPMPPVTSQAALASLVTH